MSHMRITTMIVWMGLGSTAAFCTMIAANGETSPKGDSAPEARRQDTPASESAHTTDTVVVYASGKMVTLCQDLATEYRKGRPGFSLEVKEERESSPLYQLAAGACDLAAMPRIANDAEHRRVQYKLGAALVGMPVAMDAVVLFVDSATNPLETITLGRLRSIFTHQLTKWRELGVPLEESEIIRNASHPSTGTLGVLRAKVLGTRQFTTAIQHFDTSRQVVNATAGHEAALGVGSLGHDLGVRILGIKSDDESSPVRPTATTIQNGLYPISHYLYLYTAGPATGVIKDFVRFALSEDGQRIVETSEASLVALPMIAAGD